MRKQRGLALIIVLWISLLLSLLAGSYAFGVRTETRIASGIKERAQARALAEGAVHYVSAAVAEWEPEELPFLLNGQPLLWSFAGRTVKIRVGEAAGRIDINHAGQDVLMLVLRQAGAPEDSLVALADAVIDWRDSDDARQLNGAEAPEYVAAGISPGPKDALFESVDEIGQVLGMTAGVVERLRPLVTVHGRQGVEPRYAPREVLLMLANGDEALVDDLIASDNANLTQRLPWDGYQTGESDTLHLDIEVLSAAGSLYRFSAVVAPGPVSILDWRE